MLYDSKIQKFMLRKVGYRYHKDIIQIYIIYDIINLVYVLFFNNRIGIKENHMFTKNTNVTEEMLNMQREMSNYIFQILRITLSGVNHL